MNFALLNELKKRNGFRQFLLKSAVFIALFIAVSYVIGQRILSSNMLYGHWIAIYGGMGYIFLFSIAGFVLLYRNRLLEFKKYNYKFGDFGFLIISFILISGFYIITFDKGLVKPGLITTPLVHLLFLSMFAFLFLGAFGFDFAKDFIKKFARELFYFLIFGVIVYSAMLFVWKLWPYFSWVVIKAVGFMLGLITNDYKIVPPNTVVVGDFAAKIAEACSGVYSIFLFTALYLFIIFVDWKKLNLKRGAILFIPAVAGAFAVNILRVFMLFVVGAYLSREAALGLYHSYTGMVFFLIYFGIFWFFAYPWMKLEKPKERYAWIKRFMSDSLYRNSIFLMISTFMMAFLGFIFWIIVSKIYSAENIGLATTLISIMGLITTFSMLGLNSGLIRYLPTSERKNNKINTVITLVTIVTIIASAIFLLFVPQLSPKLFFIKHNLILSVIFIVFMMFSSYNSILDSIFISYRSAGFVLFKNGLFSALKLALPFLFVGLGAYGIFGSWMIALMLAVIVNFFILIAKFSYKPNIVFYDEVIKKIGRFSFANYVAGFIWGLPAMLLPLMITTFMHPETTAYYYMAMMIASVLFIIPQATTQSLFAEGSYKEDNLKHQIWKSIRIMFLIAIPAIIVIYFAGTYILHVFGVEYSNQGTALLQLLAISTIFVAFNSLLGSYYKVKNRMKIIIVSSIVLALVTLALSYWFIVTGQGLAGIGYAWIIGQACSLCYYLGGLPFGRKKS
jgi:exosortase/archaeosortase family protein